MATSGSFNTTSEDGRYLTFYWERSSYSVENNQTKIYYKVTGAGASGWVTCGNFKLTLDGSTVYSSSDRVNVYAGDVICEGYHTFTHNSVGDKSFSAYLEAGIFYVAVNCSGSGSWALPNIPRASQPSLSKTTFELTSPVTIYTNAASSSFKHKLYYSWGEQSWFLIAENVTSSYSWTPNISMAEYIPSATSGTGQIRCDTYSGSTLLGTKYVSYTATVPASVKPTASAIVTEPTNHIAKYGALVQSKSTLRIQSSGEGVYGSTIKSYTVIADGKRYTGADVTTEPIAAPDAVGIQVLVTDTRERVSEPWEDSFTVLAYIPPTITKLSVHRCDANGTENETGDYAVATFSAAITALRNYNTATYKLRYTPLGVENPTTQTVELDALTGTYNVTDYTTAPFAADGNYSYQVEIVAEDDFTGNEPAVRSTSVSTAFTLMNWGPSGDCMAIGKVAEKPGTLEVALDTELMGNTVFSGTINGMTLLDLLHPIGSVYISRSATHPSTIFGGTWREIKDRFILAAGDTYAAGSTGGEAEHTLTTNEIPSHSHEVRHCTGTGSGGADAYLYASGGITQQKPTSGRNGLWATYTGGGQPHNNMPPYIAFYAWERIREE